ncbi:DUF4046 domain-containing protein [Bacillus mycoides]|uniref:DUF4046 domain-containing protein n=1 Tax=Bacillus mycoides TaxID=1405 RepID=UPI0021CDCACF|nr:DUF4046 domain-containing protein [Bacillus mycoides]MCU5652937.1 DUF4046 domain-containing protein [Bacillus mycoides]
MKMNAIAIEDIYQEILEGKRSRFPANTWKEDKNGELSRRVTKYLIETILMWNKEDIKLKWNTPLIVKYKLRGALKHCYNNSPYKMIEDLYPNHFIEWEFLMTPNKFWTKEKALKVLKWTIEEKEKLTHSQLTQVYSIKWLTKHKLTSPCQIFWGNSPYFMLNDLYPRKFKEWEFKFTPTGFWNKKRALEALKWTIEEQERLTEEQLLRIFTRRWLVKHKLCTPLKRYWNGSPYEMLNALYPNRYSKNMLKGYNEKLLMLFIELLKKGATCYCCPLSHTNLMILLK